MWKGFQIITSWTAGVGMYCRKKFFSISGRYGVDTNPESILRNEVLELVTECVDVVRTDTESLATLVEKLRELKLNLLSKGSVELSEKETNEADMEELIGQEM